MGRSLKRYVSVNVYEQNHEKQNPELDKIPNGQNPNGQNSELDEILNGQNPR